MEILGFIFSRWWILLITLLLVVYLFEWFKDLIEIILINRNIRKHGYPKNKYQIEDEHKD